MIHFRAIPLAAEWKTDYGGKRRIRKLIYKVIAAQVKDCGGLECSLGGGSGGRKKW